MVDRPGALHAAWKRSCISGVGGFLALVMLRLKLWSSAFRSLVDMAARRAWLDCCSAVVGLNLSLSCANADDAADRGAAATGGGVGGALLTAAGLVECDCGVCGL